MEIEKIVELQREYFKTRETLDVDLRLEYLSKLRQSIEKHSTAISIALQKDLGKSTTESFMCEIGLALSELKYEIAHLKKWAKPKKHKIELVNFPAKGYSIYEPYGVVLVMAPWNYPFMLTIDPLVGAIAAGNVCVLKPSAYSPNTSQVISDIVSEVFPPEYVSVVQGGRAENTQLLNQRFDYIFFTGGVNVGKLVMEKAAANLTPVTLELGGKSPCIIDKNCNLSVTASRVVFGKFTNCGQTCVAPDYFFVHREIHDDFLEAVKNEIIKQYTASPLTNNAYGKIINEKHFNRIVGLIDRDKVYYGGGSDANTLKIEPTIVDNVTAKDAIMGEEIFGPLMPILVYDGFSQVEDFVTSREKPLASYLFTEDSSLQKRFLRNLTFGGGCINDTLTHLSTNEMGFGGVGFSGMGSYHGKKSFETFSHEKNILKKGTWLDMKVRYQPFSESDKKMLEKFL